METKFYRWAMPILAAAIIGLIVSIFQQATADRYTAKQAKEDRAELIEKISNLHGRVDRLETRNAKLHDEVHVLQDELRRRVPLRVLAHPGPHIP